MTFAIPEYQISTIRELPLWSGAVEVGALKGGITNRNYLVTDGGRRYVVRVGRDIPVHGIMRFNELAACRAAAAAGLSSPVVYHAPGLIVVDFIEGQPMTAADIRAKRDPCLDLVLRIHREMPRYLRGPILSFNVFHQIRDYAHTLIDGGSRLAGRCAGFLAMAERLETAVGAVDLVFGHNDLLAANFIDDGTRLWVIDWDYAGFGSALFDLGGLAANNGFTPEDERAMLERYYDRPLTDDLSRRFSAMKCASLLRETMWSLVSEIHSGLDYDFHGYSNDNLKMLEAAWTAFKEIERQ